MMEEATSLFKVLADPTRLRLLAVLAARGEVCVCVLAQALGEPAFKISRHLAIMRARGVVAARREGAWIYYKLAKPRNSLEQCLHACFRGCLANQKIVKADLKRLAKAKCQS